MTTYNIETVDPRPAMTTTRVVIEVETYAEAVKMAEDSWRKTRRYTMLRSGKCGSYSWHVINDYGLSQDKNFNSGIPTEQILE